MRAEPIEEEAARWWDTGTELLRERKYPEALSAFESAYAKSPLPEVLCRIGLTHAALAKEKPAHAVLAVESLEKCLAAEPAQVPRDSRETLERLKSEIAEIVVQTGGGARVLLDDVYVGVTPLERPLLALPGAHTLRLEYSSGRSREVAVAVPRNARIVVSAEEPSMEPPPQQGQVKISCSTPGVLVSIDRAAPHALPRDSFSLAQGTHSIEFSGAGLPDRQRKLTIDAGRTAHIDCDERPPASGRQDHEARRTSNSSLLSTYVAGGSSVALAFAAGITFLMNRSRLTEYRQEVLALRSQNQQGVFQNDEAGYDARRRALGDRRDSINSASSVTQGLTIGSAIMGVVTLGLLVTHSGSTEASTQN